MDRKEELQKVETEFVKSVDGYLDAGAQLEEMYARGESKTLRGAMKIAMNHNKRTNSLYRVMDRWLKVKALMRGHEIKNETVLAARDKFFKEL